MTFRRQFGIRLFGLATADDGSQTDHGDSRLGPLTRARQEVVRPPVLYRQSHQSPSPVSAAIDRPARYQVFDRLERAGGRAAGGHPRRSGTRFFFFFFFPRPPAHGDTRRRSAVPAAETLSRRFHTVRPSANTHVFLLKFNIIAIVGLWVVRARGGAATETAEAARVPRPVVSGEGASAR